MLEQRRYAVGVSNSLPAPMLKDAVRHASWKLAHGVSPSAGNSDSQYRAISLRRMKTAKLYVNPQNSGHKDADPPRQATISGPPPFAGRLSGLERHQYGVCIDGSLEVLSWLSVRVCAQAPRH